LQIRDEVNIAVGKVIMEKVETGSIIPSDCHINLEDIAAQVLMDDLWSCGIRPSEGTGSAGAFKAQGAHLEDMRKLVFEEPKIEYREDKK